MMMALGEALRSRTKLKKGEYIMNIMQAYEEVWHSLKNINRAGGEKGCMVYTYDGLEKFAELIARECASVAVQDDKPNLSGNPHMDLNGAYMAGKGSASLMIQEHFGIEGFEE